MVNRQDPDLLDEYDFSKGVRGKYAQRDREGHNYSIALALTGDVVRIQSQAWTSRLQSVEILANGKALGS